MGATMQIANAVFGRSRRVLAEHLADAMPSRGSVLDVGCGDGALAQTLMAMRPDLTVEGVELAAPAQPRIRISLYDGWTLPFADRSFDYVILVDALRRAADPAALLVDAARVARHGIVIKDCVLEGVAARPTLRLIDRLDYRRRHSAPPIYFDRGQWQGIYYKARLTTVASADRLGLHRPPLGWLFDRRLHFVALLRPREVDRGAHDEG